VAVNVMQNQAIPHVRGNFGLGVLPNLLSGDPYEFLKNVMLEHGDMVTLDVGPQRVYLASHPDYLQHILRDNHENYVKPGMFYDSARRILGNGLVTSTGDFWLRQRRMIQPHFHRKQLGLIFDDMVDAITETTGKWDISSEPDNEHNIGEQMAEITISVIMRTMMGKDLLSSDEMCESLTEMETIIAFAGKLQFLGFLPTWIPLPGQREYERDLRSFQQKVQKIVTICRTQETDSAGLIQMLINSVDEASNEQMTGQQLFDEIITIFAAGYETTGTALTWLWTILDKHPDVLDRLYHEVDTVLGKRTPTIEDVGQLTYARQVFMETLRMHSVAPMLPRQSKAPDQLGDYELPANSTVLMFYHGVHHNPAVWTDPEVFDPERFSPNRTAQRHSFAFVPFSGGPRKCLGDEFSLLEGPLVLAMMLQRYRVTLTPGQTFAGKLGATMKPQNGVKGTLCLRN
jgi:cytochrome P450